MLNEKHLETLGEKYGSIDGTREYKFCPVIKEFEAEFILKRMKLGKALGLDCILIVDIENA